MQGKKRAVSVQLPIARRVRVSAGEDTLIIKRVIERFCPRWYPGATVVYIGDRVNRIFKKGF